ncbi:SpoIIE family protein phosphatase [Evansella tamaricis]|uniref:SpoIIE family protein phosphatase n=1 Tax=Evansella tamaricis TaxID=2069301 RepID=A0ABS6JA68_9BACI|nr:SpoIIE family protein phosphatase [Evansella tamaricis]MBU9710441.1 SpoIIE family protein phosphatase [Evansella tamaricis]
MIEHQDLNGVEVSTYKAAKKGNWCSGDSFFVTRTKDYILCAMADGLGSGEEAMNSSTAVIEAIKNDHGEDVLFLMDKCNRVLVQRRGAVLSILRIDINEQEITYSNVGNIGCNFYSPDGKLDRPVPSRGYLSGKKQKIRIQRIPYEKGMTFVLYTDGFHFNPGYHSILSKMDSPKDTLHQLVELMEDTNDDTALLIGKIDNSTIK